MPMYFCCVPGCSNQTLSRKIGVSRHRFPENEETKKAWIRAINNPKIPEDVPLATLKKFTVCGKHFKPSDYEVDPKYTIAPHLYKGKPVMLLKKISVPSLLLHEPENTVLSEVSLDIPEPGTSFKVSRKRNIEASISVGSQTVHMPYRIRKVADLQAPSLTQKKQLLPSSTEKSKMIAQQQVTPNGTVLRPSTGTRSLLPPRGEEFSSTSTFGHSNSDSTDPGNIAFRNEAFVNLSCLDQLFKRCQICGNVINTTSRTYKGAQVIINWGCVKGHQGNWKSCPDIREFLNK